MPNEKQITTLKKEIDSILHEIAKIKKQSRELEQHKNNLNALKNALDISDETQRHEAVQSASHKAPDFDMLEEKLSALFQAKKPRDKTTVKIEIKINELQQNIDQLFPPKPAAAPRAATVHQEKLSELDTTLGNLKWVLENYNEKQKDRFAPMKAKGRRLKAFTEIKELTEKALSEKDLGEKINLAKKLENLITDKLTERDIKHKGKFLPFKSDLYPLLRTHRLTLWNTITRAEDATLQTLVAAQQKIKSLERELANSQDLNNGHQATIAVYREELEELIKERDGLRMEITTNQITANKKLEELITKLNDLRAEITTNQITANKKLDQAEEKSKVQENEIEQLKKALAAEKQKNAQLQENITALTKTLEAVNDPTTLRATQSTEAQKIEVLQKENAELKKEVSGLKGLIEKLIKFFKLDGFIKMSTDKKGSEEIKQDLAKHNISLPEESSADQSRTLGFFGKK